MTNRILKLIKSSCEHKENYQALEIICALCDDLRYSDSLESMASSLYDWLNKHYKIDNINITLYDIQNSTNNTIFKYGSEFFLDGELSFYFMIKTHTHVNAVVSFNAKDKEHYSFVDKNREYIDIAFYQVSPVLQNGIMKDEYAKASSIDSVTNVYNRQYLIENLTKRINLYEQQNENISFLMIGIDRFKAVIDEFDYDVGDKVLIKLAKVIHLNIKEGDIVARLVGDEFLVALINLSSYAKAEDIAKNIIDHFSKIKIYIDKTKTHYLQKTVSIGIASYPKDGTDIEQVIKNADASLYEAKNQGRGQYTIYTLEENSTIDLF